MPNTTDAVQPAPRWHSEPPQPRLDPEPGEPLEADVDDADLIALMEPFMAGEAFICDGSEDGPEPDGGG